MLAVQRDALGDVRGLEDLLDRHLQAVVDQLHHQLIVGDAELAEAPQAGARVHQVAEQDPALRVEDVLIDSFAASARSTASIISSLTRGKRSAAAEVVVDHARRRVGVGDHHAVRGAAGDPQLLGGMVVEGQRHLRAIGQVGRDVVAR